MTSIEPDRLRTQCVSRSSSRVARRARCAFVLAVAAGWLCFCQPPASAAPHPQLPNLAWTGRAVGFSVAGAGSFRFTPEQAFAWGAKELDRRATAALGSENFSNASDADLWALYARLRKRYDAELLAALPPGERTAVRRAAAAFAAWRRINHNMWDDMHQPGEGFGDQRMDCLMPDLAAHTLNAIYGVPDRMNRDTASSADLGAEMRAAMAGFEGVVPGAGQQFYTTAASHNAAWARWRRLSGAVLRDLRALPVVARRPFAMEAVRLIMR
ncbi:MAG: hypothetical protein KGJ62_15715 [Armatimonadetes bacterium]|nr:hypothetical protein [Armatimonadota bacterium]MDE2208047.1 hypothetical protein [Armatimonadota bacterium]